jgi:hypothetical protein
MKPTWQQRCPDVNAALNVVCLFLALLIAPRLYAGTFVTHHIQSPAIAGNTMGITDLRRIVVHLPEGYDARVESYPVVYWLGGWGSTMEEVTTGFDEAVGASQLPDAITVFIDKTEGLVFLNSPEFGLWEDFMIDELIPFIDTTYRTIPTSRGRALAGASMGGLSALLLTILYPDTWDALGFNDGSAYYAGLYELHVGREGELPMALEADFTAGIDTWKNMPASLDDYHSTESPMAKIFIQLGVTISPNPSAPLHFDVPLDSNGRPVPEVLEKWRAYCLFDPATIVRHLATLRSLTSVPVIIPAEQENPADTNRYQNIYWLNLMTVAGVAVIRLDMPGSHSDFPVERLIALEEQLLDSLAVE